VSTASQIAAKATKINALPFDGLSVSVAHEPISTSAVSLVTAKADLNPMPALSNVKHNFVIFRLLDSTSTLPYDLYSVAIWNTIAASSANVAGAAAATGKFDGVIIDPEYYGSSSVDPWDYGTSTTPGPTAPPTAQHPASNRVRHRARPKGVANK
jgi:hypothetical protein